MKKLLILISVILALSNFGLLYVGTHADLDIIGKITMSFAFLLHMGAFIFCLQAIPKYSSRRVKSASLPTN